MRAIIEVLGVQDDGKLAGYADRMLEVVVDNNRDLIAQFGARVPPLRTSGVRFRPEPWAIGSAAYGLEQFVPFPELIRRGWADCAQLCAWRVAELRELGELGAKLRYFCRTQGTGPERRRGYHVEVRRANGLIEDPSMLLEF